MSASTITSKGQTTIPGAIRRHLKLKPGDRVEYIVEADGKVVLLPVTLDVSALKGLLAPAPRRLSIEAMNAAIRDRAGGK
ncbi:MAG TPA: type II toxin-antitoxin system PrlF family antitoxin [Stellaceae bacterium]